MKRDFLSIEDWSGDELEELLALSATIKKNPDRYRRTLTGKTVAMIFEKQSLRTHVTFDVGIYELGGHSVYLTSADISLGVRESVYDTAKNLERWVDGVVVRTYQHARCLELAQNMNIPVINARTDDEHPCQAVGDFMTIKEKIGDLKGKKLTFVGDGNNVCRSLMLMSSRVGMNFTAAVPPGYEPGKAVVSRAKKIAKKRKTDIQITNIPEEGVRGADAIYTDVWTSMGQEREKNIRLKAFKRFQVDSALMRLGKDSAIFLHCLPAHRGEEVTGEVMESPQSVIFDQAENRLYSQKAILVTLMR